MEALFEFFEQYIELTDDDKAQLRAAHVIRQYRKDERIKRFDEDTGETFFVLTGLVYTQYHVADKTVVGDFFCPGQPVIVPTDNAGDPAPYELTCLEDASLMGGTAQEADAFIEKFPKFGEVCFPYIQNQLSSSLAQQLHLKTLPPIDRYTEFLRARPELEGRIPQYLLANFLGITPESLSRIRKRLSPS